MLEQDEVVVDLRHKNQMTWPLAKEMGVKEGDQLVVAYDGETGEARVRRLRESYAGVLRGVYGETPDEVRAYLQGERESWE